MENNDIKKFVDKFTFNSYTRKNTWEVPYATLD